MPSDRAGRWSTTGTRPSWTDGRPPICACPSNSATATRVYGRLVAECGFTGSYSSVQRWVKRRRQEHRAQSDGFAELEWAPGSAQVDFGQAGAVVAGAERVVHFLAVLFPYSNMRWVAALPGETAECVCQGLPEVFERTGMTPKAVVFDNATGVGHRNSDGTTARTRLFSLFCAHYGFEPRFRDPYSGHGKGSVENAVSFAGRNLMVPMSSAESFRAPARVWLDACERIAGSDHYRHGVPVRELFEAEKDHMPPLPGIGFDPCDWRSVKADKTGSVVIDANRYLAGPRWRSMRLQAGVRVFEIELRDPDGGHIVTLERVCGGGIGGNPGGSGEPARDHRAQAAYMGRKPDQERFPDTARSLLDRMGGRARADLLDDIRVVAAECGFAATVKAVETVIDAGRTIDRAAIATCAKRILEGRTAEGGQDLKHYDEYMEGRA